MGADFIGGAVAIRKTRDEARVALDAMSDDDILACLEDHGGVNIDAYETTAREVAIDFLSMVYDAYDGKRRDGALWTLDSTEYVITGGMSWGDAPTDLCEAVWGVSALGVTE